MELKDRKRIKNLLPGFADGLVVGGIGGLGYSPISNSTFIPGLTNPRTMKNSWKPLISSNPIGSHDFLKWRAPSSPLVGSDLKDLNIKPSDNNKFNNNKSQMPYGTAVQQGILFATDIYNSYQYDKSADDLLMDAGRSNGSVQGFNYERLNYVDEESEKANLRKENTANTLKTMGSGAAVGATVGSIIPGLGTAVGAIGGALIGGITSIFGGKSREEKLRKRIREAQDTAQRTNTFNRSGALSDYLAQNYATEYGDDSSQQLYSFSEGKDVYSSTGKISNEPNAMVAKGEGIVDNLFNPSATTTALFVKTGKHGVDTELAHVNNNTVIFGGEKNMFLNDTYALGKDVTYQKLAEPYIKTIEYINKNFEKNNVSSGNLLSKHTNEFQQQMVSPIKQEAEENLKLLASQLELQHLIEDYNMKLKAKRGKDSLPKYKIGADQWAQIGVDSLGTLAGIWLYINASNQKIKRPNSYVENPYGRAALQGLASLRINPYPIFNLMRDQERRNLYAINRAGGLSGAQKAFANVATGIGTQRNIALVNADIQNQNNQYKQNYYSALYGAGQNDRQTRMQANQYDLDYYSKAHAAKEQMKQVAMYNILNSMQQGYSNWFKNNQFNKMYNLYASSLTDDQLKNLQSLS